MKKIHLISAALVLGATHLTTLAAPSQGLSLQSANQIIEYTNTVGHFLSECYPTRHITANAQTYHENIKQTREEPRYQQDAFEDKPRYDSQKDCIDTIMSSGGISPHQPPNAIGSDNQTYFKQSFVQIEQILRSLNQQNARLRMYFNDRMQLKQVQDREQAEAELARYDQLFAQLTQTKNAVYDRLDELGDRAERITLGKHPLLNEILDMKKQLRLADRITRLAQGDAATVEQNLPQIKDLQSQMQALSNRYAQYDVFRKGQNPRMDEARQYIKEYFGKSADFYREILELERNYRGEAAYERARAQKYLIQRCEYFVQAYNDFASSNNR